MRFALDVKFKNLAIFNYFNSLYKGGVMAIQYRVFALPAKGNPEVEQEINQFLNSIHAITIHREFVNNGDNSYFTMLIEYTTNPASKQYSTISDSKKKKTDYRDVLSPEDFALYAKIREWRKETAQKQAVQLYTILTNEQMAIIAEKKITDKKNLGEIDGFGDARMKNYSDQIIEIVKNELKIREKTPTK